MFMKEGQTVVKYSYETRGTCSSKILLEVDGEIVKDVKFIGGCNGNTKGVATLVRGMKIDDVIAKLKNIDCNGRGTSCPDQLASALEKVKEHGLAAV